MITYRILSLLPHAPPPPAYMLRLRQIMLAILGSSYFGMIMVCTIHHARILDCGGVLAIRRYPKLAHNLVYHPIATMSTMGF